MRANRGIILIAAYLIIAAMLILGAAFIGRSVSEKNIAQKELESTQAFWLADAGINRATSELARDYNWKGVSASIDDKGEYSVNVEDLGGSLRKVTSTGFIPNAASCQISRILEAIVSVESSLPRWWAAFGDKKVTFTGTGIIVDSYDSSRGPYTGTPIGRNGDVGTNSIANASIQLTGIITIHGDVIVGPGGNPKKAISTVGAVTIDGEKISAQTAAVLPSIGIPTGIKNSGDLKLTGLTTLTLSSGSYRYSSIKLTRSSTLTTSGDVTIYVDGKVDLRGSFILGLGNKPTNLTIMVLGNRGVDITGSSIFSGVLYAPKSDINITGLLEAYGAIIGKKLNIISVGSRLHYDEALNPISESEGGNPQAQIISWRDL